MSLETEAVAPFVSNLDRNIFLLKGLPKEVTAVLFALYSRSPKSLRENLKDMLDERIIPENIHGRTFDLAMERAKAFHEKYVVGYGHKSVAEHAVFSIAVENCSILAAKALEDCRLASYTEKSTRYVKFKKDSFYTPESFDEKERELYRNSCSELFEKYFHYTDVVAEKLKQKYPHASVKQCQTKSFDLIRGLLPAGTLTNVGMTFNATALEDHLCELMSSNMSEVRAISNGIHTEALTEAPTLLKYIQKNDYRIVRERNIQAYLEGFNIPHKIEDAVTDISLHDTGRFEKLVVRILAEVCRDQSIGLINRLTYEQKMNVLNLYLSSRGRHDNPGRALEAVDFTFQIKCDYGAYRDIHRHRMCSMSVPLLGCDQQYELDPILTELGLADEIGSVLDSVVGPWKALAEVNPYEAQYVVPLAYNVSFVLQANLRELFHIIELRSKKEGHPSYRKIAQDLAKSVLYKCPYLKEYLRVDNQDYEFARS